MAAKSVSVVLMIAFTFHGLCRVYSQEVSRRSQYKTPGREKHFKSTVKGDHYRTSKASWFLGGKQMSRPVPAFTAESRRTLQDRMNTGCRSMCNVYPIVRNATVALHARYQPNYEALNVNSTHFCDSDTDCSADVTIGRHYQFACNASSSNPARQITWLINTKGIRGMQQTELPADWNQSGQDESMHWNTLSQINLQIFPEDHHSSIVCRVMFPDDTTVFRDIVMTMRVTDNFNRPNSMTLDVNSTQSCESDTDCSADVAIGRHYRFTCYASGSNPASTITWLINTTGRWGMEHREIPADWSQSGQDENRNWETSSQIHLQILPEDHRSSIVCRVMFPDHAAVFKQIVLQLQVMDEADPPNSVTLDINSTHSCDSETNCSADVTIGHHYRFTCNASGSNPASIIRWSINTTGRWGMEHREIPADRSQSGQDENRDWKTSSQFHLQILPEDHHSSIVCRVMFPDDTTMFTEIVMKLQVTDEPENLKKLAMAACIPPSLIVLMCVVMVTARKWLKKSKLRQPSLEATSSHRPSSQSEESQVPSEEDVYEEIPVVRDYRTRVSVRD
ncbi:uncharacterized protein LOC110978043 isoform X2 [Acanthaster planci]|uniref:Uncharacterized protein LOC110978043 isoform X2 n=1 Tax=Acanthaster planci TaxID=133434 RepID=A0A8B7Y5A2_ACAPL|nr:uncharacterized protein LOC110978043 isoform X2 [Acanthaster planci]